MTPSLWLGTDRLPLQQGLGGLDGADLIMTMATCYSYMRREIDARLESLLRIETRS